MTMKLVFASANPGKLREAAEILGDGFEILLQFLLIQLSEGRPHVAGEGIHDLQVLIQERRADLDDLISAAKVSSFFRSHRTHLKINDHVFPHLLPLPCIQSVSLLHVS